MAQIDISNIINVSISSAPQLLSSDNVNVIGILTKETPLYPINNYAIYKNPNSCMQDWGIDSMTYRMVNNIFSQNLNVLAGNGFVVVFPMLQSATIPATAGTLTSNNLIPSKWLDVEDGSFNISVDGAEAVAITELNFTDDKTLEDIADTIQKALTTANVEATITASENNLTFTSNTTGANSSIVITANTTGTDLTTLDYLNIAQAVSVEGEAEYTGAERLQDAVARTQSLIFYEAILPAFIPTDEEILTTATNIQALNKMLFVCTGDASKIEEDGVFTTIQSRGLTKTRCLYNGMEQELLFASGYASKLLSVNFNGSGTANNLHTKQIIGLDPDTTINDTLLVQLNNAGVDCYPSMKGLGLIYCSGKNEWSDTVLFLNWLKMALETAGFNTLRGTPTKIAQTEEGVQQLSNAYRNVLEQAVRLGYVAPNPWLLPFTFGDQELFYNNIEQVGYYIYSEPVANLTQEQRDNREAPLISIALKLSGSINSSDILCFVNN